MLKRQTAGKGAFGDSGHIMTGKLHIIMIYVHNLYKNIYVKLFTKNFCLCMHVVLITFKIEPGSLWILLAKVQKISF